MNLPPAVLDLDNNTEMAFSDHEEDKRDVKIRRTVVQVFKYSSYCNKVQYMIL